MAIGETSPTEAFADIASDSEDATLIKILGPQSTISFDWIVTDEATSVVSGAGGSVTTAVDQQKYLFNTFASQGASQILDSYTLTVDYGGGVTFVRIGVVTKIDCVMTGDEPLTFRGHCEFQVGTVA